MNREAIDLIKSIDNSTRLKAIQLHRQKGVLIPCPDGVIIAEGVTIGKGTVILKGTVLVGTTAIGEGCAIGPDCLLCNTKVGSGAYLNCVQSFNSKIGDNADLGPFVHVRPGTVIDKGVHLGNFVEVKNSFVGEGTKVSHLTYVGDSDVGKSVNFGCGCVTVNYNGREKFRTTVGDHAFIGCNTNLVAPVTVGAYGYTAAGSTITEDVPENALAIARARQTNKLDWVLRKKPYKKKD